MYIMFPGYKTRGGDEVFVGNVYLNIRPLLGDWFACVHKGGILFIPLFVGQGLGWFL